MPLEDLIYFILFSKHGGFLFYLLRVMISVFGVYCCALPIAYRAYQDLVWFMHIKQMEGVT
jgi:hypothetical protein